MLQNIHHSESRWLATQLPKGGEKWRDHDKPRHTWELRHRSFPGGDISLSPTTQFFWAESIQGPEEFGPKKYLP